MKKVFDFKALDGFLDNPEIETMVKKELEKYADAVCRDCFLTIPIDGNSCDNTAFEFLRCNIYLHVKRVYSKKTWKPIKDIFTIDAYQICHFKRTCIYDKYETTVYEKKFASCKQMYIDCVDTDGNAI